MNIYIALIILNALNISNIFNILNERKTTTIWAASLEYVQCLNILKKKRKNTRGHFGDDDASPAEVDEQNYRDKKLKQRQRQKLKKKVKN